MPYVPVGIKETKKKKIQISLYIVGPSKSVQAYELDSLERIRLARFMFFVPNVAFQRVMSLCFMFGNSRVLGDTCQCGINFVWFGIRKTYI